MKNLLLARLLEGYTVVLPHDYVAQIFLISKSPEVEAYANGVTHNMEAIRLGVEESNRSLNAMHVVSVCATTVMKMIQANYPRTQIFAAFGITTEYLTIMLQDERVRQEAITFFNEEMEDLKNRFR